MKAAEPQGKQEAEISHETVLRCFHGDPSAWDELFTAAQSTVRRATSRIRNPDDRECIFARTIAGLIQCLSSAREVPGVLDAEKESVARGEQPYAAMWVAYQMNKPRSKKSDPKAIHLPTVRSYLSTMAKNEVAGYWEERQPFYRDLADFASLLRNEEPEVPHLPSRIAAGFASLPELHQSLRALAPELLEEVLDWYAEQLRARLYTDEKKIGRMVSRVRHCVGQELVFFVTPTNEEEGTEIDTMDTRPNPRERYIQREDEESRTRLVLQTRSAISRVVDDLAGVMGGASWLQPLTSHDGERPLADILLEQLETIQDVQTRQDVMLLLKAAGDKQAYDQELRRIRLDWKKLEVACLDAFNQLQTNPRKRSSIPFIRCRYQKRMDREQLRYVLVGPEGYQSDLDAWEKTVQVWYRKRKFDLLNSLEKCVRESGWDERVSSRLLITENLEAFFRSCDLGEPQVDEDQRILLEQFVKDPHEISGDEEAVILSLLKDSEALREIKVELELELQSELETAGRLNAADDDGELSRDVRNQLMTFALRLFNGQTGGAHV